MEGHQSPILITLRETGQTVADPAEDIRGRKVVDAHGVEIGKVHHLLVDQDQHVIRMMRIDHGGILGFGSSKSFVPIEAISRITDDTVYLSESGQHIASSPRYKPELEDQFDYSTVYTYYGYLPYWGIGYPAPDTATQHNSVDNNKPATDDPTDDNGVPRQ